MPDKGRKTETGHIIAVQEYRFELLTDDGRGLRLALDRFASGASQLCRWHEENIHVRITYRGEPDLDTGIALRIVEV